MTYLEKIKLALADAKGRFVGFELVSKSLDTKMNKTYRIDGGLDATGKPLKMDNPFFGVGYTYVSKLVVRAGVEYAKLATSPDVVGSSPSWATREVDSAGIVSYRHNNDGRKLYLGVAPTSGSKTVFAPDGNQATAEQLAELKPFMKKSSGQPTWLTIGVDSIAKAVINGDTIVDTM
jgi:hypothetical protein